MKRRDFIIAGGAVAASISLPARAAYPDKPARYIIPFAPGGESDIAARLQQAVWRKKFGQELVVESKPGAGGGLAWSQLNTFPGDGYTMIPFGDPRSDIDFATFFKEQGAKGYHNPNYEQDNAPGGGADPGRSLRSSAISAANMNALRG